MTQTESKTETRTETETETLLPITANTRVSTILERYGDIAPVMEAFGVKRVGRYSFRRFLTKALTVRIAAKVHGVALPTFLKILNEAVAGRDHARAESSNASFLGS